MKIQNITSTNGNKVPNNFIIFDTNATYFQSYDSIIIKKTFENDSSVTYLDKTYWDYSKTTSKYRNQFLGLTTKEIKAKIKSGEFKLANLN